MPAPLSIDLRERIVQAYHEGAGTYEKVAKLFSVGEATISRLLRRKREKGSLEPEPHGGGKDAKLSKSDLELLKELADKQSDLTISDLSERLSGALNKTIGTSIVSRGLQELMYTRKKRRFTAAREKRNE